MQEESDNLTKIILMFQAYKYTENSLLTKDQIQNIFDQQAKRKIGRPFSQQILKEVWGQAENNTKGEFSVRTFSQSLNNAVQILQSRLYKIRSREAGIPHYQQQLSKKIAVLNQLQAEYQSGFRKNYQKINVERRNKTILETKIKELEHNQRQFTKDLQEIKACIDPPPMFPLPSQLQESQREDYQSPEMVQSFENRPNPNLLTIFSMTVIVILLELLVLTLRPNFLALFCCSCLISWLFLGYHNSLFVVYLIGGLSMSLVFDLIYILMTMLGKVHTNRPSSGAFGVFIVIFLVIQMALRVVLIVKLCPFREIPQTKQYFQFMGHEIELHFRASKKESLGRQ